MTPHRLSWRVDASDGGFYLWVSRAEDCWVSTKALADIGILVVPGSFYGPAGTRHVRPGRLDRDRRACRRRSESAHRGVRRRASRPIMAPAMSMG
jgi:aspartate/methionine/tyrosine aminotransferase